MDNNENRDVLAENNEPKNNKAYTYSPASNNGYGYNYEPKPNPPKKEKGFGIGAIVLSIVLSVVVSSVASVYVATNALKDEIDAAAGSSNEQTSQEI